MNTLEPCWFAITADQANARLQLCGPADTEAELRETLVERHPDWPHFFTLDLAHFKTQFHPRADEYLTDNGCVGAELRKSKLAIHGALLEALIQLEALRDANAEDGWHKVVGVMSPPT